MSVSLALSLAGCPGSHPDPGCGESRPCADGLLCEPSRGAGLPAQCVPPCGPDDGARCENGAVCTGRYCSAGGRIPEGEVAPGIPMSGDEYCAFGMLPASDYTSDPLMSRCRRVCDDVGDCRPGEHCANSLCYANCNVEPNLCEPPNLCVDFGAYCVNPRRFARIDCDGDMDQDVECSPALVCDATAIGGCGRPPPGTE